MKIRALIVDDEEPGRINLRYGLAAHANWQLVAECASAAAARAVLDEQEVDVIFLDIQMPQETGLALARDLARRAEPPLVIFATAYNEHAIEAFEVHALDYLLKPFDDQRFERVLERVKERLRLPGAMRRFIIRNGSTLEVVKFADIEWVEASDYYASVHANGHALMLRRSLSELEGELAPHGFQRIHRSAIVNLERVRSLELREDGEYEVVLEGGQRLRMSRRYRKTFLERMPPT